MNVGDLILCCEILFLGVPLGGWLRKAGQNLTIILQAYGGVTFRSKKQNKKTSGNHKFSLGNPPNFILVPLLCKSLPTATQHPSYAPVPSRSMTVTQFPEFPFSSIVCKYPLGMCQMKLCADKLMYAMMGQIARPNLIWSQATYLHICLNPYISFSQLSLTLHHRAPL